MSVIDVRGCLWIKSLIALIKIEAAISDGNFRIPVPSAGNAILSDPYLFASVRHFVTNVCKICKMNGEICM